MKSNNKKALYESIMSSVAKEVKKALNEGVLNEEFNNSIIKDAIENKNFDNATIHIYNDGILFYNVFLSNSYTKLKNSFLIIPNNFFVSDSLTLIEYKDLSKFIDKIERKSENGKYSGYISVAYNKPYKPRQRTNLLYYEYIELTEDGAKQLTDIIVKQDNRRDNKYEYSEDTYKQDTARKLSTLKSERLYEIRKRERDAEIAKYKDLLNKLDIDPEDKGKSMFVIRHLQHITGELMYISPKYRDLLRDKDVYLKFEDKIKEVLLEILDEE